MPTGRRNDLHAEGALVGNQRAADRVAQVLREVVLVQISVDSISSLELEEGEIGKFGIFEDI